MEPITEYKFEVIILSADCVEDVMKEVAQCLKDSEISFALKPIK